MEIVEALVYNLGYKKDIHLTRKDGRKASGQDLCAWLGTQRKGKPLRWTLTLRRKWLSHRPLIPVLGSQAEGTSQPCWLPEEPPGQSRGLGRARRPYWGMCRAGLPLNSGYPPEPTAHPALEEQMPGPAHSKPQSGPGPKAARTWEEPPPRHAEATGA